ncbi:MAG: hypothetical protein KAI57_02195 [Candidatus Pacebacteria bacterium]|nr:hypothetical protein [Candidatus Paceibacterota bacterium]
MKHVFKLPEEYTFEKEDIRGTNFESKELSNKAKFAVIETESGHKNRIRENECDFFYYVLDGSGNFEINGEIEECEKGNLIVIPSDSIFKYTGKMKLFLTTIPFWYSEQEDVL